MKRLQGGLLLVIVLACAAPAPGQWLFAKKTKIIPSQRVPELILIVKTDPDERKRHHAAEELREYDVTTFTEIVPVLVDVLQHDKKMNVRLESLNSLTKIRPVSVLAAKAIEKASTDDDTFRVRLQAKAYLPKYHLALSSAKKSEAAPAKNQRTTEEPPLGTPGPLPPTAAPLVKTPMPPVQGPALFPE